MCEKQAPSCGWYHTDGCLLTLGFNDILCRAKISMRAGHIEISAIEPEDAINLFIFVTLFFGGIGLVIKGLIQFSPAP